MSKFFLPLALAALATSARADLITWGPIQAATGPTEVSLNGTLVTAKNCWNITSASPTVNGVLFSAFAPTGWGNGGNLVLNGSTSGNAGYDTLMTTSRATSAATANPTAWGAMRIDTLGTLSIGNCYEIQVWYCDDRPGTGTAAINDRVMTLSSATGAAGVAIVTNGEVTNLGSLTQGALSGPLEADPNNTFGAGDAIFGSYSIGTFTRTSTDELYLLVQGTHPVAANLLRPHVNAFQIREISCSTPSTPFCTGDVVGVDCLACGNNGAVGRGCANSSFAGGALLDSTGIASIASDTLLLTASDIPGPGLFFQSNGLATVNPFGDGMLCATVGITRMGVVFPDAFGVANYPGGLTPAPISSFGATAGSLLHYQCWYRDAASFCAAATYNTSNGVSLTWGP